MTMNFFHCVQQEGGKCDGHQVAGAGILRIVAAVAAVEVLAWAAAVVAAASV